MATQELRATGYTYFGVRDPGCRVQFKKPIKLYLRETGRQRTGFFHLWAPSPSRDRLSRRPPVYTVKQSIKLSYDVRIYSCIQPSSPPPPTPTFPPSLSLSLSFTYTHAHTHTKTSTLILHYEKDN